MSQLSKSQKMRTLVASFHQSDQSMASFARAHGLTRDQLYYWIKKFSNESEDQVAASSGFIPVEVGELEPSTPRFITIRTSDGLEIQIPI